MAISEKQKSELWLGWTHDAASMVSNVSPDGGDVDDVANEVVDVVTAYADMMLEEFEDRFDGSGRKKSRRKKRPARDEDDEDEDEDEED